MMKHHSMMKAEEIIDDIKEAMCTDSEKTSDWIGNVEETQFVAKVESPEPANLSAEQYQNKLETTATAAASAQAILQVDENDKKLLCNVPYHFLKLIYIRTKCKNIPIL